LVVPYPQLLLGLLALTLALASSAQATGVDDATTFEARCERQLPQISVELKVDVATHNVIQTVSSKSLNRMSVHAYPSDRMLGMTAIASVVDIGYDGPTIEERSSRRECIAPRIEVTLQYRPIQVYIAREFSSGSCAFREILAHEMRHVMAYQQHMPRVEAKVRVAMQQRFSAGPLYGPIGQAYTDLRQEINSRWLPFIRAELARVEAIQEDIDSETEIFRISNACQGDVAMVLNSHY
jgi:hypothetical protein